MSTVRARVKYATIYVFPPVVKGKGVRVSAAPETLTVRPGDVIDWTVVNATAAESPGRVSLKWKDKNPLKGDPKEFERSARATVRSDAKPGRRYRYSIVIDGVEVFDPELEIMA
jgi:plastocyanin